MKTIEFGIFIYLSDRAVLLAFWKILNQGNRPNRTENTWHYVKRIIFYILIEVRKEGFMAQSFCLFAVVFCASFELKPI